MGCQFFLIWLFNKVGWFYNYSATGMITAPSRSVGSFLLLVLMHLLQSKYLFLFSVCFLLAWIARNLTRGKIGRSWMAIRDMDIAAEIIELTL